MESNLITSDPILDEVYCIRYLEKLRWPHFVVSPYHPFSQVYTCKHNTYKCRESGKYFNVKTRTLFHKSKIPLSKWFQAILIIERDGIDLTSVALASKIATTQKTAWHMLKKIKQSGIAFKKMNVTDSDEESSSSTNDIPNFNITDWLQKLKD